MAQKKPQTSRKSAPKRGGTKKMKQEERRAILIGVSLIAVLIFLVAVSVFTFTSVSKYRAESAKQDKKTTQTAQNDKQDKKAQKTFGYENANVIAEPRKDEPIKDSATSDAYVKDAAETYAKDLEKEPVVVAPKEPKPVKRPTPPARSDVLVKMAILLDDGGANMALADRFVKINYPIGLAVLPHLKHSKETARTAKSYGKSVFLHLPMEPNNYPSQDPGQGALLTSMPEIIFEGIIKQDVASLGVSIDGVNNHMGSALTQDHVKMAQVMSLIKSYTNVFVDSRTSSQSIAYDECIKANLRCGINKKFIDNENDVNEIISKLYEGGELAKKGGEVLVIGHLRSQTLEALEIALPNLERARIAIVPIGTIVR